MLEHMHRHVQAHLRVDLLIFKNDYYVVFNYTTCAEQGLIHNTHVHSWSELSSFIVTVE